MQTIKRVGALMLTLLVFFAANAQQVQLDLGLKNKKKGRQFMQGVLAKTDNDLWLIQFKYRILSQPKYYFVRLNASDMKEMDEVTIDLPEFKDHSVKYDGTYINKENNSFVLGYQYDKEDNVAREFAYPFNANSGELGSPNILAEYQLPRKAQFTRFVVSPSQDSMHVLIYHAGEYLKQSDEKFHVFVVNASTMKPEYDHELSVPYPDNRSTVSVPVLAANGQIYLSVITQVQEENKRGKLKYTDKWQGSIVSFDKDGKSGKEFNLGAPNVYIGDHIYRIDPKNGNCIVAGLYRKSVGGAYFGTFLQEIDGQSGKEVRLLVQPFGKEDPVNNEGQSKKKKKSSGVAISSSYVLRDLISKPDGSYQIVAEERWQERECTVDQRGNRQCHTYYHRGNILVANFGTDPASKAQNWFTFLRKRQEEVDFEYRNGYISMEGMNKSFFIFNDHIRNQSNAKKPSKNLYYCTYRRNQTCVSIQDVNNIGKPGDRLPLFNVKDQKMAFGPGFGFRDRSGKYYFIAYSNKRYKIFTVTIK